MRNLWLSEFSDREPNISCLLEIFRKVSKHIFKWLNFLVIRKPRYFFTSAVYIYHCIVTRWQRLITTTNVLDTIANNFRKTSPINKILCVVICESRFQSIILHLLLCNGIFMQYICKRNLVIFNAYSCSR